MGISFLLIFYSLCCSCFYVQFSSSMNLKCHSSDMKALEEFMKGLDSPIQGWTFSSTSNCCLWNGVTCDSSVVPRVVALELSGQKLRGNVSESLADLVQLRTLNLSANFLTNSLPLNLFFFFQNLQVVDLSSNDLSGFAPFNFTSSSISFIDLSHNKLTGNIDPAFCKIANRIQVLNLSSNRFEGKIPPGFGNCTSLEHLSLGSNLFTGNLPQDLFALSNLKTLDLHENLLSGELSFQIGNLSNLIKFDISANKFSGWLPNVFSNLGNLKQFTASSNKFSGPLPLSLCNSPTMVGLTSLNLGSNYFNGTIGSLSSCQQLRTANLGNNRFDGDFPDSIKNLKSLTHLSVSKNALSNLSAALQTLQNCKNLTVLILTFNFQGEVMPADSNLRFENMRMFVIGNCRLGGSIPEWLSSSTKLQILDLSWNLMSGVIPSSIGKLENLFYLDLSNNSLSGSIPRSFTQLKSLVNLNSTLKGEIFEGFSFFSRKKQISGREYKLIGGFPALLDISYNILSGPIWTQFGNLKDLHTLDLSNNRLSGNIPSSLSKLTDLEVLDLSYNNLTGHIPSSLARLNFLSTFNVAHNQLQGSIPSEGQFHTFPESSFVGNNKLCGYQTFPCEEASRPQEENSESGDGEEESLGTLIRMPLGIGVAFGFVSTVSVCIFSGMVFPKEKNGKFQ